MDDCQAKFNDFSCRSDPRADGSLTCCLIAILVDQANILHCRIRSNKCDFPESENIMGAVLSRLWSTGVVGTFLAGVFVLLPVALTFVILDWMVGKIASVVGPGSILGDLLASGGGTIIGPNHGIFAFILGLLIALAAVWGIGLLVRTLAKQRLKRVIDSVFERLPFVRAIYKPVAQVVRLISGDGDEKFKDMAVVSCSLGGKNGVDILGLVTSSKSFVIAGETRRLVYLPTAPLPMSGGLILVPESNLEFVPEISVEELMQIYFSLGGVVPDAITS